MHFGNLQYKNISEVFTRIIEQYADLITISTLSIIIIPICNYCLSAIIGDNIQEHFWIFMYLPSAMFTRAACGALLEHDGSAAQVFPSIPRVKCRKYYNFSEAVPQFSGQYLKFSLFTPSCIYISGRRGQACFVVLPRFQRTGGACCNHSFSSVGFTSVNKL